jgi:glycosyltransferase involved in cell wall biosynthesis
MRSRFTSLYMCYWSLRDPLCQSQSLAYLRELAARGHRFALVTFEQPPYALDRAGAREMRRTLRGEGIEWYPLTYHKRHPLLATAYDCAVGVALGVWIAIRHRPRVVHSRASIPAAIALGVAKATRLRFLYDADSRLSEEYADNGHWSRASRAFRVTAGVEDAARKSAASIVVLSSKLRDDFVGEFGVRAPIEVIPCCVDVERFRYDPGAREARRRELGVGDARLFVYVGKSGPRYLPDELFGLFRAARERFENARLLILSGDDPDAFHAVAERVGVDRGSYDVRRAPREDVASWLSAADAGLALIRTAGCERGGSPIKIGEYLAVGLPVVITPGIGDYSDLIASERLGVVLEELSPQGFASTLDALSNLWAEGDALRARCRTSAERHLALDAVGVTRYEAVYEGLLRR